MDRIVENDKKLWGVELGTEMAKDYKLGLKLRSPEVQLHYMHWKTHKNVTDSLTGRYEN